MTQIKIPHWARYQGIFALPYRMLSVFAASNGIYFNWIDNFHGVINLMTLYIFMLYIIEICRYWQKRNSSFWSIYWAKSSLATSFQDVFQSGVVGQLSVFKSVTRIKKKNILVSSIRSIICKIAVQWTKQELATFLWEANARFVAHDTDCVTIPV